MSDRETRASEALLAASNGYREFYAEEEADEYGDIELVRGFADWLMICPAEAPEFAGWTADQFRAEWERWNS